MQESFLAPGCSVDRWGLSSLCNAKFGHLGLAFESIDVLASAPLASESCVRDMMVRTEAPDSQTFLFLAFFRMPSSEKHFAVFMRERDQSLVGLMLVTWSLDNLIQIIHLYIAPAYRRRKIASTWIGMLNCDAHRLLEEMPLQPPYRLQAVLPKHNDLLRLLVNRGFHLHHFHQDLMCLVQGKPRSFENHRAEQVVFVSAATSSSGHR
jgi:hypothetical protein